MKPYYQVVAGVITYEDKILCMQRPKGKYEYISLRWEFPGGKIEPGEAPQEALQRELREELEYDVKVGKHITTVEHEYPDFQITMAAYWCEAATCDFVRKEHADHRWLSIDELDTLDWCEADIPIMKTIAEKK